MKIHISSMARFGAFSLLALPVTGQPFGKVYIEQVFPAQEVQGQKQDALQYADPEAIPAMVASLESYWNNASPDIPFLLAKLGAPAELALLNAMDDPKNRSGLLMGLAVVLLSNPELGEQTARRLMSDSTTGDLDRQLAWVLQIASGPSHEWLEEGLKSPDVYLRIYCAKGLAWNLDPAGLPALEETLKSSDRDVVLQGIKSVGRRGLTGEPWRGLLLTHLRGESDVRDSAAWALAHTGMAFRELLIDTVGGTQNDALESVGDFGRDALVHLIFDLPVEHRNLRGLLSELRGIGAVTAGQSAGIANILHRESGSLMRLAGGILQASPDLSAGAWESVLASTKTEEEDRRGHAACLLGRADASNPAVEEALFLLLKNPDESPDVRHQAAMSLALLGSLSPRVAETMIEALESDHEWALGLLMAAPTQFGPRVAQAIIDWLGRSEPLDGWAQSKAFSYLEKVGVSAGPAVEAFLADADTSPSNRAAVVRTVLGKTLEHPEVRLRAILESDPKGPLALHAAYGLVGLGVVDDVAIDTLIKALSGADSGVGEDLGSEQVLLAIEALEQAGEAAGRAIPGLLELFDREEDFAILRDVAEALVLVGPGDKRLLSTFLASLSEGSSSRQRAALIGLEAMGAGAEEGALETLRILKSENSRVRSRAIDTLTAIAGDSVELRESLGELLEVKVYASFALQVLSEIGASPGVCFQALQRRFWNGASNEEMALISKAIAPLGSDARTLVYSLAHQARQNASLRTRVAVIEAIGKLGAEGAPALPALIWSARWYDREKRVLCSRFGGTTGLFPFKRGPSITIWSDATWLDVRVASIYAIAAIGERGKLAIPTLEFLTRSSDRAIREAAQEALDELAR